MRSIKIDLEQHSLFYLRQLKENSIYKRLFKTIKLEKLDADRIHPKVCDTIVELNFSLTMVALGFARASVVSSDKDGLITKLNVKQHHLFYIHCSSHRLNLIIVDLTQHMKL